MSKPSGQGHPGQTSSLIPSSAVMQKSTVSTSSSTSPASSALGSSFHGGQAGQLHNGSTGSHGGKLIGSLGAGPVFTFGGGAISALGSSATGLLPQKAASYASKVAASAAQPYSSAVAASPVLMTGSGNTAQQALPHPGHPAFVTSAQLDTLPADGRVEARVPVKVASKFSGSCLFYSGQCFKLIIFPLRASFLFSL